MLLFADLSLDLKMDYSEFEYDYLIVGAGLFGAVFANLAKANGKKCLVIDKRAHIGGNIYTREVEGIPVHEFGAHIFHTSNETVWRFVNRFAKFNNFVNSPVANYKGRLFNLPFNMNTFYAMWGVKTPAEALAKIDAQRAAACIDSPKNLEEQAISLVGTDIYETLIKGYTEKQWGRDCKDLPPSIIKRLPVRLTFDNNYFNARYQVIPEEGYTQLAAKLLDGIDVRLNTDFLLDRGYLSSLARRVIFTGPIDAFFENCFGPLEYRTVRFETEVLPTGNYQGVAVVNYTEREIPYTRIIEHKHFVFGMLGDPEKTVISREYPEEWDATKEPYYPVNDEKNARLYEQYAELAQSRPDAQKVVFGGRLGAYRYYDMDKVIESSFNLAKKEGFVENLNL